ncbi:Paxillin [Aphelenchoides besseyi]|nr:Paxillin [Aphelenchoides besseyi]
MSDWRRESFFSTDRSRADLVSESKRLQHYGTDFVSRELKFANSLEHTKNLTVRMRSSAIAELEDTLQRLSVGRQSNNSFHPSSGQTSSMSASLSPSSNHGIHTIPKGDCAGCGQPIIGQVLEQFRIVIAMGKNWHPEHYVCCHCSKELAHLPYFERGGKAYCEEDYFDLFSPRCAYCNGPIREKCVHALNKTFHLEHFACVECGRHFGAEGYHEKDSLPYCREDYLRLFGPKCRGCKNPVKRRFITALGATWDPECFVCADCSKPFKDGVFFEMNGSPLCETHYHERRGSVCSHCHQPIHGRCVMALGQRFHPEHFFCNSCRKAVNRTTYKEMQGRAFCQKCFEKVKPSYEVLKS